MLIDVAWITSEILNNIAIMIREQLTHRQAAYVVGQESSSKPNKTQSQYKSSQINISRGLLNDILKKQKQTNKKTKQH